MLADTSNAKTQSGAADTKIKVKMEGFKKTHLELLADIGAYNTALKSLGMLDVVIKVAPMPLVEKTHDCVNKNKNCIKLSNTVSQS